MTALRKVLVVDDDPVVGASFNRVLSGKGYIVVSAESGAQALERLREDKFDAVFTDLRMPGMDGVEVAQNVRTAQPWVPVVIITGYGSPASEARARAAGVSEFLHKPLSPEAIEDMAAKAIATARESSAIAVARPAPAAVPAPPQAAAPPVEEPRLGALGVLKNMALFLVAPFIGLAYMVLLPFVGLGMLAWVGVQSLRKPAVAAPAEAAPAAVAAPEPLAVEEAVIEEAPAEPVGFAEGALVALKLLAAPFIGLAFIVVMPFAGLAALAWMGVRAAVVRTE
jgi:CheY-like chemotaxis protein